MGRQGSPREQPEEGWCGAGNSQVRPLALRLHSQVRTDFLEGDLQLPAQHQPFNDSRGSSIEIGARQRLGLEFPQGITYQDPPNRDWGFALVIPDCGIGGDFQCAVRAAIPYQCTEAVVQTVLEFVSFWDLGPLQRPVS